MFFFAGLAKFFHNGEELRKDAISLSIHKIRNILGWFEGQKQLHFYASSLLFVYEGSLHTTNAKNRSEALKGQKLNQAKPEDKSTSCGQVNCSSIHEAIHSVWKVNGYGPHSLNGTKEENVEVRMIDFAHVFPCDSSDDSYMYGLRSLLCVLEQILQD